jgi:serine/threonine-protein kinase
MDGTRLSLGFDESPTIDDPLIGSILDGRYQVLELVGRGGMGAVYRARQVNIGRDVAVKVVNSFVLQEPGLIRRFENEARIISALRHPNTLKLIDFGKTRDERPYLVTEFLVGRPLERVLKEGAVDVYWILRIMRQVVDALTEAHAAGIVHRDLKPENIFIEHVGGDDIVRVLDFGIAKLGHSGQTATGTLFGTPTYMSPEQARGEVADGRSDLYSVGVILFRAITGQPPFGGEEPMAILLAHVNEAPPLLSRLAPQVVPPDVEALVMQLLEKEPNRRPSSAFEVKQMMERALSPSHGMAVARPYPTPAPTLGTNVDTQPSPFTSLIHTTGILDDLRGPNLLKPVGLAFLALAIGIVAGAFAIQRDDPPAKPPPPPPPIRRAPERTITPPPPPATPKEEKVAPVPEKKKRVRKSPAPTKVKKDPKTGTPEKPPPGFIDFEVNE